MQTTFCPASLRFYAPSLCTHCTSKILYVLTRQVKKHRINSPGDSKHNMRLEERAFWFDSRQGGPPRALHPFSDLDTHFLRDLEPSIHVSDLDTHLTLALEPSSQPIPKPFCLGNFRFACNFCCSLSHTVAPVSDGNAGYVPLASILCACLKLPRIPFHSRTQT